MVNFGPLAAEIVSLVRGTPGYFNVFHVLAALLHGTLVVGISQTAALNRGRHLYSAGRPSRWALAHILVGWVTRWFTHCSTDGQNVMILLFAYPVWFRLGSGVCCCECHWHCWSDRRRKESEGTGWPRCVWKMVVRTEVVRWSWQCGRVCVCRTESPAGSCVLLPAGRW